MAGDEVVQLYLKFPPVAGAPNVALRGFERIHLDPGQSQKVHFDLKNRDLGMVTSNGNPIIAGGDYTISIGGGQPDTGASSVAGDFQWTGRSPCRSSGSPIQKLRESTAVSAQSIHGCWEPTIPNFSSTGLR